MKALQYIANKAHTLAAWKLEPSGHEVTIAELQEIESKAREALTVTLDLLEACNAIAHCTKPAMGSAEFKAWIKAKDAVAKAERKE